MMGFQSNYIHRDTASCPAIAPPLLFGEHLVCENKLLIALSMGFSF